MNMLEKKDTNDIMSVQSDYRVFFPKFTSSPVHIDPSGLLNDLLKSKLGV